MLQHLIVTTPARLSHAVRAIRTPFIPPAPSTVGFSPRQIMNISFPGCLVFSFGDSVVMAQCNYMSTDQE